MKTSPRKKRLALSPVISALILSTAVLVIGGSVWGFTQGAMTISGEEYAENVLNNSEAISERFIIEHVATTDTLLKIYVFNYGIIDIEVKIKVEKDGVIIFPYGSYTFLMAKEFAELTPLEYIATSGEDLVVTVETRRGNSVYYRYIEP